MSYPIPVAKTALQSESDNRIKSTISDLEVTLLENGYEYDEVSMAMDILRYRYDPAYASHRRVVPKFTGHELSILGRMKEVESRYSLLKSIYSAVLDQYRQSRTMNKVLTFVSAALVLTGAFIFFLAAR